MIKEIEESFEWLIHPELDDMIMICGLISICLLGCALAYFG
jgi:hypothetical protein